MATRTISVCMWTPFYSRKHHPNETHTSTGAGHHHSVECILAENKGLQHQGLSWFTYIKTIQDCVGIESEVKIKTQPIYMMVCLNRFRYLNAIKCCMA